MRTRKKKGRGRKKTIKSESPILTSEIKLCMNTYGACCKPAMEIIYASKDGKNYTTNNFCSKECMEMYKGEKRGVRTIRELAKKIYEEQLKKVKPTETKKEPLKNKVKLYNKTYILDNSGKYPEYKLYTPPIKDNIPVYSFNPDWVLIDPNKVDNKLIVECKKKLFKNWYTNCLKKWKVMPKDTLENYLYRLTKNKKEVGILKTVPNAPVTLKTAEGNERIDKNYWKYDYLLIAAKKISKKRFPYEIGYYLAYETYNELYNDNKNEGNKKSKWKYKEVK